MPICQHFQIPDENIFCNAILFQEGHYADFDRSRLINRPEGKRGIIEEYMKTHSIHHSVMIGDGSTDLETCSVVDCFIGYGGVVEREIVKQQSPFYTVSFEKLLSFYKCLYDCFFE